MTEKEFVNSLSNGKQVMGYKMKVVSLEDVMQGKCGHKWISKDGKASVRKI
jgi:hypothetical protein